jgi:hypothetical protein
LVKSDRKKALGKETGVGRQEWGNREIGKWGNGEMGKWGNGEMGKWGNGEMGKWGNGEFQLKP